MMEKIIIFGAGGMGKEIYEEERLSKEVIAFWDNGSFAEAFYKGTPIEKPNINRLFDKIVLGACYPSMITQLKEMGIPDSKIYQHYVERRISARINFLKNFSQILDDDIQGSVAEAGVFQGEFAKYINKYFPNRKLYLFDTFEGFAESDVKEEHKNSFSGAQVGQYSMTSEELVLSKMAYPDNCVIYKGFFPNTAIEAELSEQFCFVNLDMDLYRPTLEGLNYFSDKMVRNGVVLVHDYFSHYKGVKQAVEEFMQKNSKLRLMPIGDEISIAIVGF